MSGSVFFNPANESQIIVRGFYYPQVQYFIIIQNHVNPTFPSLVLMPSSGQGRVFPPAALSQFPALTTSWTRTASAVSRKCQASTSSFVYYKIYLTKFQLLTTRMKASPSYQPMMGPRVTWHWLCRLELRQSQSLYKYWHLQIIFFFGFRNLKWICVWCRKYAHNFGTIEINRKI